MTEWKWIHLHWWIILFEKRRWFFSSQITSEPCGTRCLVVILTPSGFGQVLQQNIKMPKTFSSSPKIELMCGTRLWQRWKERKGLTVWWCHLERFHGQRIAGQQREHFERQPWWFCCYQDTFSESLWPPAFTPPMPPWVWTLNSLLIWPSTGPDQYQSWHFLFWAFFFFFGSYI